MDVDTEKIIHCLAKPPFSSDLLTENESKCVDFLQLHYHKIHWDAGTMDYHEMFSIIRNTIRDARIIYVKGSERTSFLRKTTSKFVIDLDQMECPKAKNLPDSHLHEKVLCSYPTHERSIPAKGRGICSLDQALKFTRWIRDLGEDVVG